MANLRKRWENKSTALNVCYNNHTKNPTKWNRSSPHSVCRFFFSNWNNVLVYEAHNHCDSQASYAVKKARNNKRTDKHFNEGFFVCARTFPALALFLCKHSCSLLLNIQMFILLSLDGARLNRLHATAFPFDCHGFSRNFQCHRRCLYCHTLFSPNRFLASHLNTNTFLLLLVSVFLNCTANRLSATETVFHVDFFCSILVFQTFLFLSSSVCIHLHEIKRVVSTP